MNKCKNCGMSVPDSETRCPICDSTIEKKLCCPRCNSTNLDILVKEGRNTSSAVKTGLAFYFFGLLGGLFARSMEPEETTVTYQCKNCGNSFRMD